MEVGCGGLPDCEVLEGGHVMMRMKELDQNKKGACAMDTYKKTAVREMFSTLFKKTFNKKTVKLKHSEVESSIIEQIQWPASKPPTTRFPPPFI